MPAFDKSGHPALDPNPRVHHTGSGYPSTYFPKYARFTQNDVKSTHEKTALEPGENGGATTAVYPARNPGHPLRPGTRKQRARPRPVEHRHRYDATRVRPA